MTNWGPFLIVHPKDAEDLDRSSYDYMATGLGISDAKAAAYDSYKRKQHCEAAAYHIDGMESNKKDKNFGDADRYFAMYCMHAHALGLSPLLQISPMIETYRNPSKQDAEIFRPHSADALVLGNK